MSPSGCSHVNSFKVDNWKQNLRAIYQCFVWSGTPETRKRKAKSCICHMCGAHLNRLHSCLYCVFFGCFTKKHIHEHAKLKRHNLAIKQDGKLGFELKKSRMTAKKAAHSLCHVISLYPNESDDEETLLV